MILNGTRADDNADSCKKLVDICAVYVLENEEVIQNFYTQRNTNAFDAIFSRTTAECDIEKCYEVLKDVKKKRKLLGVFEDIRFLAENFKEDNIYFTKKQMLDALMRKPYNCTPSVANSLMKFVNN